MAKFSDLIVKITGDASGFNKTTKQVSDSLEGLSTDVLKAGGSFSALGKSFTSALGPLVGASSVVAIGTAAFGAAQDFEEAMRKIAFATGATQEKLKGLGESFKNVYVQTGADSGQVAGAISMIAQRSGLAGQALETMALSMLKFAKVGGVDVSEVVPRLTRLFGSWKIATEDQAGAMQFLQSVSQRTAVPVTQLLDRLTQFGAPLREVGLSMADAAVMLAKFEAEGLNVEEVMAGMQRAAAKFLKTGMDPGQAFQAVIKGIQDGTISAEKAIKLFGTRSGLALVEAIQAGRFSDVLSGQLKEGIANAAKGAAPPKALATEWKQFYHDIEINALEPLGSGLLWIAHNAMEGAKIISGLLKELGANVIKFSTGWVSALADAGKKTAGLLFPSAQLPYSQPGPKAIPTAATAQAPSTAAWMDSANRIPSVLPPTKEELAEQKKRLEASIKVVYDYWDRYQTAFEKLQEEGLTGGATVPARWMSGLVDMIDKTKEYRAIQASLKTVNDDLAKNEAEWAQKTWEARQKVNESAKETIVVTTTVSDILREKFAGSLSAADNGLLAIYESQSRYNDLLKAFGITSREIASVDLESLRKKLEELEVYARSSAGAFLDFQDAYEKVQKKRADVEEGVKIPTADLSKDAKKSSAAMQQVSLVVNDVARGLTDVIFKAGTFGDVMKRMAIDVGKAITRSIIEAALKPLIEKLTKIIMDATKLSSIFGSGTSAAGGASGAAQGGAASGFGGAVGGMVGMISGIVSAIGSIGTWISTIRLEGTMNGVEWNTRKASIHLETLVNNANQWWPKINDVTTAIWAFRDLALGWGFPDSIGGAAAAAGGAGGYGVQINVTGSFIGYRDMDSFVDELVRRIKARL